MHIALVYIHVKPEFVEAFIEATKENTRTSVQEIGVARFDFIQQKDNPSRFVLIEVYRDETASAKHKEVSPLFEMARHSGRHDGGTASRRATRKPVPR